MNAAMAIDDFVEIQERPRPRVVPGGEPTISHWDGRGFVPISKERSDALIYVENRLQPWANWIRDSRAVLGYPTVSLLYKAMRRKAVRLRRAKIGANPMARKTDHSLLGGPELTVLGSETRSFRPTEEVDPPAPVLEVDRAVSTLAPELRSVLVANYFVYGSIQNRAEACALKVATFSTRLRAAKYSVYSALMAASPPPDEE